MLNVSIHRGFLAVLCTASFVLFIASSAQAQTQSTGEAPQTTGEAAQSPSDAIEVFHGAISKAMHDAQALGYDGRHGIIEPAVAETFDILTMVRAATGRSHWNKFSEQQRTDLLDAFKQMTVAGYAGRFNDYTGQFFETLGEEPGKRNRILVKTRLVRGNGEQVAFNYLMRKKGQGWVILDIYLDGTFSELAVRRSEFSSVLRDKGYQGLMAAIARTTARYRDG